MKFTFDTGSNTISYNSSSASLNNYLLGLNGAYQGANWKILANNRDNFLTIYNKKNNILQSSLTQSFDNNKNYDIGSFKEPPIEYNLPLKHVVNVNNSEEDIEILSSYDNLKDDFANKDLKDTLKYDADDVKTVYEKLKKPINGLKNREIEYNKFIYPKKEFVGLKETRIKPDYAEIPGTGSNGYDGNIAEIRSFWKKNYFSRKRSLPTLTQKTGSINSLNIPFFYCTNSESFGSTFLLPLRPLFTDFLKITSSFYLPYNSQFDNIFVNDNLQRYDVFYENNTVSTYNNFLSIYDYSTSQLSYIGELSPYRESEIRNFIIQPAGTYVSESITGSNNQEITRYNFVYDNSYYRARPRPQYLFINHRPSYSMAAIAEASGTTGIPPLSYGYDNYIQIINGQHFKNTGLIYCSDVISKNTPWYDSYESFFEDIKQFSKKYSFVPEYKISDFIEYYIKNNQGNFFTSPPKNYLSLDGISGDTNSTSSIFASTNNFNKFIFENEGDKKIKIKINAVKKLLPYNGFYPSQRATQIVDLFSKSFFNLTASDFMEGYTTVSDATSSKGVPIDQQVLTVIQPLFAPGVLFNTIKASVAVDFPTFISNDVEYSSSNFPTFYSTGSSTPLSGCNVFYTIGQNYNFRFPFKSLLDINNMIPREFIGKKLYYLNPTFYSSDYIGWSTFNYNTGGVVTEQAVGEKAKIVFPQYLIEDKYRDYNQRWKELNSLYTLGINNYLSEIVKFFLKDEQLNSFRSKQQNELNLSVVSGTTYSMQVSLYRSNNQKQILNSPYTEYYTGPSAIAGPAGAFSTPGQKQKRFIQESEFYGPPTKFWNVKNFAGKLYTNIIQANNYSSNCGYLSGALPTRFNEDPAYAPHAPPYYYGRDVAIISYTPDITGLVTIKDIVGNLQYDYQNQELEQLFNNKEPNNYKDSPAYQSRMKISASIKFDNILKGSTVSYDQFGNPININESEQSVKDVWSIQTIFETPLLNFSSSANQAYGAEQSDIYNSYNDSKKVYINNIYGKTTGLWYGYGTIPQENDGIFFSISDVSSSTNTNIKSLIDLCKFEKGTKKIGSFADRKKISECIVMIPYVENNPNFIDNLYAKNIKGIVGENDISTTTSDVGPFYFEIDKKELNLVLDSQFEQSSRDQIKKILQKNSIDQNNSIIKTVKFLSEYNIPPHLDWLTDKSIDPFIMYFFEFSEDLTANDLANIWQGLMPDIAKNAKLDELIFEHPLKKDQLFHGKKLPDNIKFKIFKAKKKASISYYDLTDDSSDDDRFKFNFQNSAGTLKKPDYSYNWPYDYFSLVELVNIEAGGTVTSGST